MAKFNMTGLESGKGKEIAGELNRLLADYQVFYMTVRGFHWNIKGFKFFELHAKFEQLYNELQAKVDEIAERILTLGQIPLHTLKDTLQAAEIKEPKNVGDSVGCVSTILENYKVILRKQRDLFQMAQEAKDEGTANMISDYIREQEKQVWMFSSYLGGEEEPAHRERH